MSYELLAISCELRANTTTIKFKIWIAVNR